LNFKRFRYIKFLLRRATLLGSNFVIDKKTLTDLRLIYSKYTDERKLHIENSRKRKLSELNDWLVIADKRKLADQKNISNQKEIISDLQTDLQNQTLQVSDLYDVEKSQNFESRQEKSQILQAELLLLEKNFSLLEFQIKYVQQMKRNIIYKDISLREFSYFYVSLIKEITLNNESKVLSIERNVDSIIESVRTVNEKDFYFLLRLIKFENISILKNSLNIIIKDFICNSSTISFENYCFLVRNEIKGALQKALSHYRLSLFKQFFKIGDITEWINSEECNYIIHLIYLLEALRKENKEVDLAVDLDTSDNDRVSLEAKTQGLLNNLFRMICDPNFHVNSYDKNLANPYVDDKPSNGGYIALKYKGLSKIYVPPSNILITNSTYIQDADRHNREVKKLIETEIDNASMSYLMLNGLSNIEGIYEQNEDSKFVLKDYPLKPWTVLELSLSKKEDVKYWKVNRGAVFPTCKECNEAKNIFHYKDGYLDIDYYFNEFSVIDESCNYIVFFRIADLSENNDKILNEGKAVFTFYSSQKEIAIERLRLMLLVSPDLIKFLKKHYEKDSLIAFMDERERLIESTRLKHGYSKFLGAFDFVAKNNTLEPSLKNETIDLFRNQLEAGPLLSNKFEMIRKQGVEKMSLELDRSFSFITYSKETLVREIEKIIKIVYQNKIYETSIDFDFEPVINESKLSIDFRFSFYSKIFKLLITEIVINAKKSQELIVNNSKYLNVTLISTNDLLTIKFENNFASIIKEGERARLIKGNFKYSSRGLSLIYQICDLFSRLKPKIDIDLMQKKFCTSINIKNLEKWKG